MSNPFGQGSDSVQLSGLYAKSSAGILDLREVSVRMVLGSSSVCNLKVIAKQAGGSGSSQIKQHSELAELGIDLKPGSKVQVFQKITPLTTEGSGEGSGEVSDILLYCGYVTSVSLVVNSEAANFAYECAVDLRPADALYSNVNKHVGALYRTAQLAGKTVLADLATVMSGDSGYNSKQESFDSPAKFAAEIIDMTTKARNNSNDSDASYDKLESFINLNAAPKLNSKVAPSGPQATSKAAQERARFAERISKDYIVRMLQTAPGLAVFTNYISQFGLTLAPRISDKYTSEVVLDVGINKTLAADNITAKQVLGFTDTSPSRVMGKYHAVAVRTSPMCMDTSSTADTVIWTAGYGADGTPQLTGGEPLAVYEPPKKGGQSSSPTFSTIGPVTVLSLPAWLTRATPGDNNQGDTKKDYAEALAKTYFSAHLGTPGTLVVNVLYTELEKFYNKIGEEFCIELPSASEKMVKRYGRLVEVSYSTISKHSEFSASCSLGFDNVCTEQEFNTFGIKPTEMLCTANGGNK